jgi:signal transduction histidine kinase
MNESAAVHRGDPGLPGSRVLLADFGVGFVVAAVILGVLGVLLVSDQPGGDVLAAVLIQTTTLPVLLARIAPPLAAWTLAGGVLLNEIVLGPQVRCGVVLPVLFVIVYQLGSSAATARRLHYRLGLVGCAAVAVMELVWDPALDWSAPLIIGILGIGFYAAGVLISSRNRMIVALRERTAELRRQRNRTAAVEVAADRARVGTELEILIRSQIRSISASAELAGTAVRTGGQEELTRTALTEIEQDGRETLNRMREVVGSLRDAPTQPAPGLDQIADLVARSTGADARLRIEGDARPLTANVELSAYRIIEQLLTTLHDRPAARVEVIVRFHTDALELTVSGPAPTAADSTELSSALSAVQERAQLHGGSVRTTHPAGRRATEVRLPLLGAVP